MEGGKRNSRPLVGLLLPAGGGGAPPPLPKGPTSGLSSGQRSSQLPSLAAGEGGPWLRPLSSPGPDSFQSPAHPTLLPAPPRPRPSQVSKGQTEKAESKVRSALWAPGWGLALSLMKLGALRKGSRRLGPHFWQGAHWELTQPPQRAPSPFP